MLRAMEERLDIQTLDQRLEEPDPDFSLVREIVLDMRISELKYPLGIQQWHTPQQRTRARRDRAAGIV